MDNLENITKSTKKCREIKHEILRFGVNQLEIEQLIKLLALELEDREKMISIVDCLENKTSGNILIPEE
ncbi:MAG: hypothetical protein CMB77_04540 [Euryarchaeota archaeon]|nr:hypothetical protein [Euryarchaeota archaeon]|tara:strand:+ start:5420 stop:5626 length:207 start_codon:yes stop_codon:yes gene_type:complete